MPTTSINVTAKHLKVVLFRLAPIVPIIFSWILFAQSYAVLIPDFHLDGSFQTAATLFRAQNQAQLGYDLFPYLGPVVLIFFPVFELLGASMSDSLFVVHFTIAALFAISITIIAWLASSRLVTKISLFLSLASLCLLIPQSSPLREFKPIFHLTIFLEQWVLPGNSLRPLRAFAPYLLVLTYFLLFHCKHPNRPVEKFKVFLMALVNILVLLFWSVDYALISSALFSLFFIYFYVCKKNYAVVLFYSIYAVFSASIIITILGWARVSNLFTYYYKDVRGDQYWYFGPWNSNSIGIRDFFYEILINQATLLHILTLVFLLLKVRKSNLDSRFFFLAYLGLTLFVGGLVSTIGGHQGGYFWAFRKWGWAILGVVILTLIIKAFQSSRWFRYLQLNKMRGIYSSILVVTIFSVPIYLAYGLSEYKASTLNASDKYFDSKLGGFLSTSQQSLMGLPTNSFVEEYTGIMSAGSRPSTLFPVDSNIHALGSMRKKSEKAFSLNLPSLVTTTAPNMSTQWVSWNISANWWFYKVLFVDYSPRFTTPTIVVWERSPQRQWESVECVVEKDRIVIPKASRGLFDINLIKTSTQNGFLDLGYSMIQNNLNIAESGNGYIAINPNEKGFNFPAVQKDSGSDLSLDYTRGDSTVVESCTANYLDIRKHQELWETYSRYFQ